MYPQSVTEILKHTYRVIIIPADENKINNIYLEQTPGNNEGQGGLAYCSQWGCQEYAT